MTIPVQSEIAATVTGPGTSGIPATVRPLTAPSCPLGLRTVPWRVMA